MREQWELFTCDYCGAVYKGRKENICKNNSFLKVYKVKDVVDSQTHNNEFCGVNCCQKYISEILLSGLCESISLDRATISYYDEQKDKDTGENIMDGEQE